METPEMIANRTEAARRLAEARVRRMVAENLMLAWSHDFLLKHGPKASASVPDDGNGQR
jgi:hypothetical protein